MSLVQPALPDRMLYRIAAVISFIQFTNALEYMMFNPIFAFMAGDFRVPISFSGYVSGAYTFAAVISGMAAFYWIDRFNKRHFLIVNMTLLAILTLLTTCTNSFAMLLTLRFCAGLVGGTTMGVGTSLLINAAPANIRSKMLSTVIASFSMVSIVGMPTILFLCTHLGWLVALWLICVFCLLAVLLIGLWVPNNSRVSTQRNKVCLDAQTLVFASCNALVQFSPMLIIPCLVPIMTQQLGVSPERLPWLFFAGGVAGYLSTKITGILTSRFSSFTLAVISTLIFLLSLFIPALSYPGPTLFIILFLSASYSRLVASSALTIQFPDDEQRAGFGSLQTSLMYLVTTAAFFLSSALLSGNSLTLPNLNRLLAVCAITAVGFPLLAYYLQHKLKRHAAI